MSVYIDADKVMERERMAGDCRKCKHYISSLKECAGGVEMKTLCHFLYYAHGEDVAPVRHGKWLFTTTDIQGLSMRVCSECGFQYPFALQKFNYCPVCGARMDEEEEEEDATD